MKKLNTIARPRRFILILSALALASFGILAGSSSIKPKSPTSFGMLSGSSSSRLQSQSKSELRVVNNTESLQIVSQNTTADGHLHLVLKNISTKDVNGYDVHVGGQGRITTDTSSGDRVISPGATDDLEFPAESTPSNLTILAVMFADGSIEGDPAIVKEIKQWRSGLKRQLIRSVALLDATLESPDVNTEAALDRLNARLSSLSVESNTAEPMAASGTREAKDDLINNIQILRGRLQRNGTLRQRQRLLDLKGRIERRIASL